MLDPPTFPAKLSLYAFVFLKQEIPGNNYLKRGEEDITPISLISDTCWPGTRSMYGPQPSHLQRSGYMYVYI
jgi:hypothetical protein